MDATITASTATPDARKNFATSGTQTIQDRPISTTLRIDLVSVSTFAELEEEGPHIMSIAPFTTGFPFD